MKINELTTADYASNEQIYSLGKANGHCRRPSGRQQKATTVLTAVGTSVMTAGRPYGPSWRPAVYHELKAVVAC